MSRALFVSNGALMVGIDSRGYVQDLYYPYVGQENHTNARQQGHRIGIWVDGHFSWIDSQGWDVDVKYKNDSMISVTEVKNPSLQIEIKLHDFVDCELNVFARKIQIKNTSSDKREFRLFMHQVFLISESIRDVTCQYLPEQNVVLHYRGRRVFIIGGEHANGDPFDQHAIGLHGIEGQEGTFRDAEDGELSGNNVEHGTVDSTIRFRQEVDPGSSVTFKYWISAGQTTKDALAGHYQFSGDGFHDRYEKTEKHWQDWLDQSTSTRKVIPEQFADDVTNSLLIIKSHIDRRGGIIASGDSDMLNYRRDYYSYCWPRDSSFVLWPLIRLGYSEEAKNYFEFARDVIHPEGFLAHKYQPDRSLGSSWHPYINYGKTEAPIQEDETAITIYMLGEYLKATGDEDFVSSLYGTLIQPAVNWMDSYVDSQTKLPHASYDLWEQKFLTNTYTVGVVYGALITASDIAEKFEYPDDAIRWRMVADDIRVNAREALFNRDKKFFYKGFVMDEKNMLVHDDTIDVSSLYGATMFGLYDNDDEYVKQSIKTLTETLVGRSITGGVPRYQNDDYYRSRPDSLGNPWFVTTLWYGQLLINKGKKTEAEDIINWCKDKMLPSGVLSEQLNPDTGEQISVAPLIWSHSEFINTILDLQNS